MTFNEPVLLLHSFHIQGLGRFRAASLWSFSLLRNRSGGIKSDFKRTWMKNPNTNIDIFPNCNTFKTLFLLCM